MKSVFENCDWEPPAPWTRIRTIDMHTGGEPLRVFTSGLPPIKGGAALHYAKGELQLNEKITIESILGSTMTVRAAELTKFGPYDAVIPEVGGTASITGRNEFYFDPEDPLGHGFIFR